MSDILELAKLIDHTNLKNNLNFIDIENLCKEAIEYNFYGVCVQPYYVPYVCSLLRNSTVRVVSVVDFPFGCSTLKTKLSSTEDLVKIKLDEIDIVMNLPAFLNKEFRTVEEEISNVLELCRGNNVKLKVIIETGLLLPEETAHATLLLCEIGVDFIKTSTGVVTRGASYDDIKIIKEHLSGNTKIKASGGIRTLEQVLKFVELGVARIGTSTGVQILKEFKEKMNTE